MPGTFKIYQESKLLELEREACACEVIIVKLARKQTPFFLLVGTFVIKTFRDSKENCEVIMVEQLANRQAPLFTFTSITFTFIFRTWKRTVKEKVIMVEQLANRRASLLFCLFVYLFVPKSKFTELKREPCVWSDNGWAAGKPESSSFPRFRLGDQTWTGCCLSNDLK